ncbi:RimK/LysX family protein [Pontixanthobacter aestiaquae]|uniref:ATP-dependent zinc protease n=1 Tax=Pontixanthobacter aestiaquae TaxID=1509367 RepID=A0A844Z8K3_9SPHN|nr:RimK/LysX family protein [Pontixanthobacter aestiaquae]MDN3645176.1 RimK/LysX family protein [Pontixanthobacter aestiaquae]MXO83824.1 ATP-dependent zinc protease [Pontixanthobacter aestiaquae]
MATPKKETVGWREVVALPELGITGIPAKIDTGARTSSLHANNIELFERDGEEVARFDLDFGEGKPFRHCEAVRVAHRTITSSNGLAQERLIVKTILAMGGQEFRAEFSLADRSDMVFPMLIGRTALRRRFLVNPGRSFLVSNRDDTKEEFL